MTTTLAIAIASTVHAAFATDAGAADAIVARRKGLLPHEADALRFIMAHPAYSAGRPSLKASLREAAEILRTVEKVCAAC